MKIVETRELPLTLELAKQHLRVGDSTHDDLLIEAKLEMAVAVCEDMTGRIIRERIVVFEVLFSNPSDWMTLPTPTIEVLELFCAQEIISNENYKLYSSDFEDRLFINQAFAGKSLKATCLVGYKRENIPPAIKAAILLVLGTLYDHESDQIVGRSVSELSLTAEKLLAPWRVTPYGYV